MNISRKMIQNKTFFEKIYSTGYKIFKSKMNISTFKAALKLLIINFKLQ